MSFPFTIEFFLSDLSQQFFPATVKMVDFFDDEAANLGFVAILFKVPLKLLTQRLPLMFHFL